jgi:hypothetical protein
VIGMATKLIEEKRNVLYPLKAITRPRVNAFFLDLTDVPHQALSSNLSPKVLVTAFSIGVVFGKQGVFSGVASLSMASDGCSCSGKMTEVAVIATIVW